jgi:hypothetical protein
VNRARGVRDRTDAYLVESRPESAAIGDGIGVIAQCCTEAVGQRAGCALEHEGSATPEQVGQFYGAARGRDRRPDPFDDQVGQLSGQRAEVIGEHLDHVKCLAERDTGPDPVGHQAKQRGTAHHEGILAVRAHQPDLVSPLERGRVQRRQPVMKAPGQGLARGRSASPKAHQRPGGGRPAETGRHRGSPPRSGRT